MNQYPVIIITRDRLESLRQLVGWLEEIGQENIWFCDNASTYPPLVDYLKSSPHHTLFNEINFGHRGPWLSGLVTELGLNSHFIITDPDVIPCSECPRDVLDVFAKMLTDHSTIDKVGFSLRIDDLPDHYEHAENVRVWESQFWVNTYSPGFYFAPIDTTFAMYRPGENHQNARSLRAALPYVARHVPWYQDSANPTEELTYYLEHADSLIINWDRKVLPASLRAHLIQMTAPHSTAQRN
jgi:hypothetical protein